MRAEVERQMKMMEAKRWTVGLNPNGGGAYIKSPDGKVYFRLYGYAQPIFTLTDSTNGLAFGTTDFRIRRARLDFSVDYDDIWKLFIEIDGQASGGGTGLVEGYVQASTSRDGTTCDSASTSARSRPRISVLRGHSTPSRGISR